MADEPHGFTQTRARLDEIVAQVRKKDTSLEKSLDLLEEGVRLANQCTELIDHADWEAAATGATAGEDDDAEAIGDADVPSDEEVATDAGADDAETGDSVSDEGDGD